MSPVPRLHRAPTAILAGGAAAAVLLGAWLLSPSTARAAPPEVQNPTGLPIYPNLTSAFLEDRLKTDAVGHWCMHLNATTGDSLDAVENWYRRAMRTASETDVRHDGTYDDRGNLDGIKLSVNIDSVAVYKASKASITSIDLVRCSPRR